MPHQESEQICAEILKSLRPAQGIEASASLAGILKLLHNHETSELHDSIGQSVAGSLLQFFINPDEASGNDSSVRRWAGLVLSQLCLKSTSTATSLGAEHNASADLQGLGRVILSQTEGEDLKIVSGMIIKSLVKQCVDIGLCLPCDTPYDQFPAKDSDEWMLQFQDFLDAVLKGNLDLLRYAP
ncbi:uncharacterized protein K452DRAFT_318704 [Aplosporella prunicola CBS 121167]|uniref:Uncharacterized protein n=1 Tax=Aplosporella prunicola CBS 121167 TaxID=1176127 RepID=A0A6A6BEL8_9PEZI|nr:uncharacterized protein K452DRAFT_318704 [Aplosporella prunicola CBS 121167]KAF2141755.1 hypothetical protein K452DRAFT_318704 [Aplosporella prunicola CBS 121167]